MNEATLRGTLRPQTIHGIPMPGSYTGITEHSELNGRDADDQHPISAITNLAETLEQQSDELDEIKEMLPETGTPGYFLRKTIAGTEWADGKGDKGDKGDPGIPGTVISETEPEEEILWIDPTAAELIHVPEIKDDTINTTDTWSSSKIDDMLTELSDKIKNLEDTLNELMGG